MKETPHISNSETLKEKKKIYLIEESPSHPCSPYRCSLLEVYIQHARNIYAARWRYISTESCLQVSLARGTIRQSFSANY